MTDTLDRFDNDTFDETEHGKSPEELFVPARVGGRGVLWEIRSGRVYRVSDVGTHTSIAEGWMIGGSGDTYGFAPDTDQDASRRGCPQR